MEWDFVSTATYTILTATFIFTTLTATTTVTATTAFTIINIGVEMVLSNCCDLGDDG